jgi:hypothetical protein
MASCFGQEAGGSRQVKLINGVGVPLLKAGESRLSAWGLGGLPPFGGQEQKPEWTRVSTVKARGKVRYWTVMRAFGRGG